MSNEELNKKLARWAGFTKRTRRHLVGRFLGEEHIEAFEDWQAPNRGKWLSSNPFTQSLDACFKWLVPKLMQGQCEIHTSMPVKKGTCFARVWYGFYSHYEGYAETPALALCLAFEKLIDGDEMPEYPKVKCDSCDWRGDQSELIKFRRGIPLTEDVECKAYCPVCGNEDIEYEESLEPQRKNP